MLTGGIKMLTELFLEFKNWWFGESMYSKRWKNLNGLNPSIQGFIMMKIYNEIIRVH